MDIFTNLVQLENQATAFGFKWETSQQIMAQIRSECSEVEVHFADENKDKLQEELGDLLHAVFSLCVFSGLNPKVTLEQSLEKFSYRLNAVKQLAKNDGLDNLAGMSFDELMSYWSRAKEDAKSYTP